METPRIDPPAVPGTEIPNGRNCREIIRFLSDEDCRKAIKVLLDLRQHHTFTSYDDPNEWWLYTDTVRKLREHGVPFQWLTEHV
jgi:hypothetical protein